MTKRIEILTKDLNRFEFTTNERNVLETIAYGEPVLGGDAVYSARVLLGINPLVNTGSNKKTPQSASSQCTVSAIYPNPAQNVLNIEATIPAGSSGMLTIYNEIGNNIISLKLKEGENLKEVNLTKISAGIYVYKIYVDNKMVKSDKIVIIK